MQTTTQISPREAAKLTGKSKATITAALRDGRISGVKDPATDEWHIEPAELFRVFPAITTPDKLASESGSLAGDQPLVASQEADHTGDASASLYVERLKFELASLQQQAEAQREERERERRQQEERISDLVARLDASETERRATAKQLTALLTDQTVKAQASAEEASRGWFGFRRKARA